MDLSRIYYCCKWLDFSISPPISPYDLMLKIRPVLKNSTREQSQVKYAQLFFVKTQGAILRLSHLTSFPPFHHFLKFSATFLRKRKSLLTWESNISAGAVYTYPVTISKLICSSGHSSVSCRRKKINNWVSKCNQ